MQYPNRYQLKKVEGTDDIYDLTPAPGEVSEEGTLINKATLLQDATAALYGLGSDSVPDDVFQLIETRLSLIQSNVAIINLTVQDTAGNPMQGIKVQGVINEDGNPMTTNESGQITGYITEGQATISVSGYFDIADYSESISVTKGDEITKTIQLSTRDFLKITSSTTKVFSQNVEQVDVTAVGGGGGGSTSFYGGAGGGGGYCTVQEGVSFEPDTDYQAIVGSGGYGRSYSSSTGNMAGGNGGTSSFLGVAANGGMGGENPINMDICYGGAGNGKGGDRISQSGGSGNMNGVAGSVDGYSSFSETTKYGGGGGGTQAGSGSQGAGAGYGGAGREAGQNGYGGGGGQQASGGSGCIAIRMHLKTA